MVHLLGLLAVATTSAATPDVLVCAAFDTRTDTLSEDDRRVALALFAQALQASGRTLVEQGCAETVTLSHVKVGDGISVTLRADAGTKLGNAPRFEALGATYLSLLGPPPAVPGPAASVEVRTAQTMTPGTPAAATEAPRRRGWFGFGPGHGHFYARLGQHGSVRNEAKFGPSLGIGYRFEVDRLILDASSVNLNFWRNTQRDSYSDTWNAYLRLMAFRYLDDLGLRDLFAGAGLSYGELKSHDGLEGDGMQGELGVGYEFLRSTAVRAFIQAVVTFPFYKLYSDIYVHPQLPVNVSDYAFTGALSVGVGF